MGFYLRLNMNNMTIKSNAKINICLNVNGKREDGYHELDMVMLPIELCDYLYINENIENDFNIVKMNNLSQGEIKNNIISKAIDALYEEHNFYNRFIISVDKNIPMQAGLGGGSSNAAFTLKALNQFLDLKYSNEKLCNLGLSLGSDVPFFINDKPARCRGRGEILTEIKVKNDYYVLLVKPNKGCSTKDIYQMCDSMDIETGNVDLVIKALENGDDDLLAKSLFNSLENPAIKLVPEIGEIKKTILSSGLKMVKMTGSGSTVFALSKDIKQLKNAAIKFKDTDYFVTITKVVK